MSIPREGAVETLPNLKAEIKLAQAVYQIPHWIIESEEVEGLKHPLTGERADGLCNSNPENRTAYIQVDPTMDLKDWYEVVWHEVAHCLVGTLMGERVLEENVVYPIGRALAWFRFNAPELLEMFAASLPWSLPAPLASLVREASRGNFAQLAASIRAQAKGTRAMSKRAKMLAAIEKSAATDEEKKAMVAELDDLAPDSEKKEEEEKKDDKGADVEDKDVAAKKAAETTDEPKPAAAKKAIGVDDNGERNDAASVAARVRREMTAIETELDAAPHLTPDQRKLARGLATIDDVKAFVKVIPKPAKVEDKKAPMSPHASTVRGGQGGKGAALAFARVPSSDKGLNERMRVDDDDDDGNLGITLPDDPAKEGFLMKMSIAKARGAIKAASVANIPRIGKGGVQ